MAQSLIGYDMYGMPIYGGGPGGGSNLTTDNSGSAIGSGSNVNLATDFRNPAGPKSSEPGGGGDEGMPELNLDDFAATASSSSYSGLPKHIRDWLAQWSKGYLIPGGMQYWEGMNRYKRGSESLIDQTMRDASLNYKRQFGDTMRDTMKGELLKASGAGGSGMLGSSPFAASMAKIGEQFAKGAENAYANTQLWGQQQKLQRLQNIPALDQQFMGTMGNLLGLARYGESQSQSYNPTGLLGLLPFM